MKQIRNVGLLFKPELAQACHDGLKTVTRRPVLGWKDSSGQLRERVAWMGRGWTEDNVTTCRDLDPGPHHHQRRCTPPAPGEWHVHMDNGFHWQNVKPLRGRIAVGDLMWVRETWRPVELAQQVPEDLVGIDGVLYRGDSSFRAIDSTPKAAAAWGKAWANGRHGTRWRPSIHMPMWAARTWGRVVDIRAERLLDIDEEDARRECPFPNWCGSLEGWGPDEHGYLTPHGMRLAARGLDSSAPDGFVFEARAALLLWWDEIAAAHGYAAKLNPWVWRIEWELTEAKPATLTGPVTARQRGEATR